MGGGRVMQQILALMVTLGPCTVASAMSTRDNFWHGGYKDKWIRLTPLRSALHPLRLTFFCLAC